MCFPFPFSVLVSVIGFASAKAVVAAANFALISVAAVFAFLKVPIIAPQRVVCVRLLFLIFFQLGPIVPV